MDYLHAILSVTIFILVIARNHLPGQLPAILRGQTPLHYIPHLLAFIRRRPRLEALLDDQTPLLTHPRLLAFIRRHALLHCNPRLLTFIRQHPRLHALLHRNPRIQSLIHLPPPRPTALSSSPLGLLAPETIQQIASFLPPSSAASFASTCLSIRLMTGTQYLVPLRASPGEMLTLLEFFALGLNSNPTTPPSHLLCLYCRRLVPYPTLCGPTATPLCKQNSAQGAPPYVPRSFQHQLFHTAMTMHRHGRSPHHLIQMIPNPTITERLDSGMTRQASWRYRIIEGSLYQRVRWTFITPRSDVDYTILAHSCPHYKTYQAHLGRMAKAMQYEVRDRSGVRAYSEMVSCQQCRTVLRIGCRRFRGLGLGLFLTCWSDLGDAGWVEGKRLGSGWNEGKRLGPGWKDVKYSRKWLMDYFDSLSYTQRYFDFEGMDTPKDRRELLAAARSVVKG